MPDPDKLKTTFKQLYSKCGKFKNDTPQTKKNKSSDQMALTSDDQLVFDAILLGSQLDEIKVWTKEVCEDEA